MSCHTDGSPCGNLFFARTRNNVSHCDARVPATDDSATVTAEVYPPVERPSSLQELPRNAMMYDSVLYAPFPPTYTGGRNYTSPTNSTDTAAGGCGKPFRDTSCGRAVFDYIPSELSFQEMDSDTWFGFLYDMGPDGGNAGTPCYYLITEKESRSGTTTSSSTSIDPETGDPVTTIITSPAGTPAESSKARCVPCLSFSCTPVESYCSYNYNGPDETGDPDCPYPLIFGIGTNSNKVVITYNGFSSEIPDGVTSVSFVDSGDGIDEPAWDPTTFTGNPVIRSQNTWQSGEEQFETFAIFEGNALESGNAQGLRVKCAIRPALSDTDPVTFVGTEWEFMELMDAGQNYAVNDTFTLSYTHTHPDSSQTVFTIDIKITAVAAINSLDPDAEVGLIAQGDTLNGHVVIHAFHTDIGNFSYHVMYLDGNGNDFVKDTQYTTDRGATVTARAGYGIVDRAWFGGYFEFFEKSVQYTVHDLDREAPDVYNVFRQPEVTLNLTNGVVTSATIEDGGANWNLLAEAPQLVVTDPNNPSGRPAVVEGTFTGGVLTAINITDGGAGYAADNPPQLWIRNIYTVTDTESFAGADSGLTYAREALSDAGSYPELLGVLDTAMASDAYSAHTIPISQNNTRVLSDFQRNRIIDLPQRLYRVSEVDALRDTFDEYTVDVGYIPNDPNGDFQASLTQNLNSLNDAANTSFDNLEQEQVPDTITYRENYVETTQRRFADMPRASTYTKYMMKQYRADPRTEITLNITVGCRQAESGCTHLQDPPINTCPPPLTPATFTTNESEEEDDGSGGTQTVNYTNIYTYLVSPLLGPGCQDWEASGSMLIRHNLTRSTQTYAAAVQAYGNPFDN